MPQRRSDRAVGAKCLDANWLAAGWMAVLCLVSGPAAGDPVAAQNVNLQLEVFLDGRPAKLIGAFMRLPDGQMASQRRELREIGIAAPGTGKDDDLIVLESIPDLVYRYDETRQTINLVAPLQLRSTHDYDGQGPTVDGVPVKSTTGAVLNYNLYTSALRSPKLSGVSYQGASASLDARLFSPWGTLSQSGILGSTTSAKVTQLRLETTFAYSDPDSLRVYKAGDTISSGLAWTRPVRMGGFQVQRNFGLRPDLVTQPLASVSGSAAVPSTLDVYVNNIRTFSQEIEQGPYRISNLPLVGGDGTARIVLHDASGHEIEQTLPFYTSARLLKPGFMDYSVEAGLPRRFYGVKSDDYGKKPIASASLRRGIHEWLTVEAHSEGGMGLYNGGVGAVTKLFSRAALTTSLSASHSVTGNGFQSYAAFETRMFGIGINIASQRSLGAFDDLASVTAALAPTTPGTSVALGGNANPFAIRTSIRPPRVQDRVSLSFPMPFDRHSSVGVSLISQRDSTNRHSKLASISYSRNLPFNASLYATAYKDFSRRREAGLYFGLSMPLGLGISGSSGGTVTSKGWNATADASRALGREIGDYGWRVRGTQGGQQSSYQAAAASYRTSIGRGEVIATQQGGNVQGSAEFEGAIAAIGGGIYAANRIDDSFALVNVGVPNVDVLYENRHAGKTNASGNLLIPELRSYQRNKIEIDPRGLPINSDAPTTQDIIAPADRSGIVVDFRVKTDVQAAVVILRDASGKDLAAGLGGQLEGGASRFVIGYDGRAYITGLGRSNKISVDKDGTTCSASFDFAAQANSQVILGPIVCR